MNKKSQFTDDAGMTWDVEIDRALKDGKIIETETHRQRNTGNVYTITRVDGEIVSRKGN